MLIVSLSWGFGGFFCLFFNYNISSTDDWGSFVNKNMNVFQFFLLSIIPVFSSFI